MDLSRLYRLSAVPVFMMIVFLVVAAHECAHGLTCRHFNGEVHEIGFMLIFFQPALYCNVSDAWLFPEKSKRLWVGFAGPYFELFVWALAVLVWRATEVETWINYAALIIMATSSVKTLINLNPLIKLDGYYLLSDYLEIPNLRRRSFKYVGDLLGRLVGLPSRFAQGLSRRERWIYVVYGVLSTLGSLSILVYVLVTAGGYLVEGRQPTAVLVSMGLLVMKFRRRFRRLFGKASSSPDEFDDVDDFDTSDTNPARHVVKANDNAEIHETEPAGLAPVQPKSSKLARNQSRATPRRMAWVALGCVTFAILVFGHTEWKVTGPFNILPRENADVRAGVEGIIEKVYVDEGDEVREGDLIAKLFDHNLQAELQKVESDLASKQARLRMLQVGTRPEEIELARKQVE